MTPTFLLLARRRAGRAVALALAGVLALHGLTAAAVAARGPLHVHGGATGDPLVQADFRRAMPTGDRHVHGAGEAERHHHAQDGTAFAVDDPLEPAEDEARAMPGFLALPEGSPCVRARVAVQPASRAAPLSWTTRTPAPPERPPRAG